MTIQISSYQISDSSSVYGGEDVRVDITSRGTFRVNNLHVSFDPTTDAYPTGSFTMRLDLTDSLKAFVTSTSIEQVNTHGFNTPTAIISGRCDVRQNDSEPGPLPVGCRFWMLLVDNEHPDLPHTSNNSPTPDIVSFIIYDREGSRIAYGTGPVVQGDIKITPSTL